MGTENDLDVEGQTEPPICGLKNSVHVACTASHPPPHAETTAGTDATDTVGRGSITSTDGCTVDTAATAPDFTPESAHTFSVPDICTLLATHRE
jgi:hypothetical protein